MTASDAAEVVERGLVVSWTRQARWHPGHSIRDLGGLRVVLCGIRDQTQQVALVAGPVADPEPAVIAAEVCFERAGWRPAFDLVAGAHPAIEGVLDHRGFRVVERRPGMVCDLTIRDRPSADSEAILELGVSVDRGQIVELQQTAFELAPGTANGLIADDLFADPDVALIVAREHVGGPVIGSITVHLDAEAAAIVGTAVHPEHRRSGVGSALTAAALDLAAAHRIPVAWLQATPAGERVYRRLGFVAVAACDVWLR